MTQSHKQLQPAAIVSLLPLGDTEMISSVFITVLHKILGKPIPSAAMFQYNKICNKSEYGGNKNDSKRYDAP